MTTGAIFLLDIASTRTGATVYGRTAAGDACVRSVDCVDRVYYVPSTVSAEAVFHQVWQLACARRPYRSAADRAEEERLLRSTLRCTELKPHGDAACAVQDCDCRWLQVRYAHALPPLVWDGVVVRPRSRNERDSVVDAMRLDRDIRTGEWYALPDLTPLASPRAPPALRTLAVALRTHQCGSLARVHSAALAIDDAVEEICSDELVDADAHERAVLCKLARRIAVLDPAALVGHSLQRSWLPLLAERERALSIADTQWTAGRVLIDIDNALCRLGVCKDSSSVLELALSRSDNADDVLELARGSCAAEARVVLSLAREHAVVEAACALSHLTGVALATVMQCPMPSLIDSLLLERVHRLQFVPPPPKPKGNESDHAPLRGGRDLDAVAGTHHRKALLFDFAAFYPSIVIQRRLCFRAAGTQVLPQLMQELLDARRSADGQPARQSMLKLIANSVYGCLASSMSRFEARETVAAPLTEAGRALLDRASSLALDIGTRLQLAPCVVRGVTDSLMVLVDRHDETFVSDLCVAASDGVIRLRLEREFDAVHVYNKKSYAAHSPASGLQHRGVFERKDAPWVRRKVERGLELLLSTGKLDTDADLGFGPVAELVYAIDGAPMIAGRPASELLDAEHIDRKFYVDRVQYLLGRLTRTPAAAVPAAAVPAAVVPAAVTTNKRPTSSALLPAVPVLPIEDLLALPLCIRRHAARLGPNTTAPHLKYDERTFVYRALRSLGATHEEARARMLQSSAPPSKRREHEEEIDRYLRPFADRVRADSARWFRVQSGVSAAEAVNRSSQLGTCSSLITKRRATADCDGCPYTSAALARTTLQKATPHLTEEAIAEISRIAARGDPMAACAREFVELHGEHLPQPQSRHPRHYVEAAARLAAGEPKRRLRAKK